MDEKIINPFMEGAIEVLSTMAFIKPIPGKPYIKADQDAKGDISGIIGLTGEDINGSLALSFSKSCILGIVANMLGEKYDSMTEEVQDAVGEITNMIAGVARKKLENFGFVIRAAIPTVVCGNGHLIKHIIGNPSIVIPFGSEYGDFFVDVCMGKTQK